MLGTSSVTWFEIPATDLGRAQRFYESILGVKLAPDVMGPMRMAVFPAGERQPTGCLMQAEGYRPAADGATVYLNLAADLSGPLAQVPAAGGKVLLGKTGLPNDMGFYAQLLDTEGNRVGLFSPN